MNYEILFKRNDNNQIVKMVYTDKDKYERQLINCRKWEKENKIDIIPQDINEFIKTGVKI
jgi:hypothetical protein